MLNIEIPEDQDTPCLKIEKNELQQLYNAAQRHESETKQNDELDIANTKVYPSSDNCKHIQEIILSTPAAQQDSQLNDMIAHALTRISELNELNNS